MARSSLHPASSAPRRQVTLALDEPLWQWLRSAGDPVTVARRVLERARLAEVRARARSAEHAVEVLIRRHLKELRKHQGGAPVAAGQLRELAEDAILRACEDMHEPAIQAAAERVRLQLMIQRGQVENVRVAKAELQRLRVTQTHDGTHDGLEVVDRAS